MAQCRNWERRYEGDSIELQGDGNGFQGTPSDDTPRYMCYSISNALLMTVTVWGT
jgi:hypothetical protein